MTVVILRGVPDVAMSEFCAPGDSSVLISVDVVYFSGNLFGLGADCSLTPGTEPASLNRALYSTSYLMRTCDTKIKQ